MSTIITTADKVKKKLMMKIKIKVNKDIINEGKEKKRTTKINVVSIVNVILFI